MFVEVVYFKFIFVVFFIGVDNGIFFMRIFIFKSVSVFIVVFKDIGVCVVVVVFWNIFFWNWVLMINEFIIYLLAF